MNTRFDRRGWLRWVGSFLGFPLAGLAAKAVAGPIDSTGAGIAGGLAAGLVLGGVQAVALRLDWPRRFLWAGATSFGAASGLAVGSTVVDFATDTSSLVVMGAWTGLGIGVAQAVVLPGSLARRAAWGLATPLLWALGWLVTSQVIADVDAQYANFGASGALVATMLGGVVLAIGTPGTNRSQDETSTSASMSGVR